MKNVLAQLKQYKKASYLTMGFTTLEVIMEVLLPFVTAMVQHINANEPASLLLTLTPY